MKTTLPTDSAARKDYPMFEGCLKYFPAALAGVAKHSKEGNDKHNPGQPMHHARGKSMDHENCILRHLTDIADMQAHIDRVSTGLPTLIALIKNDLLTEANALAWRALALSQELHEKYGGAPLAPGAVEPAPNSASKLIEQCDELIERLGALPGPDAVLPPNCNCAGCRYERKRAAKRQEIGHQPDCHCERCRWF